MQGDVKSFVDLFPEGRPCPVADSPSGLRTKGCSERWRRVHTLNRAALFPFVIIGDKSVLSHGGLVKKAPFTLGRPELEDVVQVLARVGYPLSNEMQIQETKIQAHPRVT